MRTLALHPCVLVRLGFLALLSTFVQQPTTGVAQGTAFTYQGRLDNAGTPAGGLYDFSFTLYTAASGGTVKGGPLVAEDISVSNGLFTVTLDFGTLPFGGGADRWLQIGVRPGASTDPFTLLTARQQITSAPYAITALGVSGPINGGSIIAGTITSSQLAAGAAAANLSGSGQSGVASGGVILSPSDNATDLLNAGYVKIGQSELSDLWQQRGMSVGPSARYGHSAMWTGTEMLVWGGADANPLNDGFRYDPALNRWTPLSTTGAPTARSGHASVWTGTEMIVWGGTTSASPTNTGGRYNPTSDTWTPTSTLNAPSSRRQMTAIWTGSEMVIWGGLFGASTFGTGGRYHAATDTWTPVSTSGAPSARHSHTAVWTGSEMIIWGGHIQSFVFTPRLYDGGRYQPGSDSWSPVNTNNAPTGRAEHTAVWTGSEMIVWGGRTDQSTTNTGSRYSPGSDSWTPINNSGVPGSRAAHSALWTGSEMIVWGGYGDGVGEYFQSGGRYDPLFNSWAPVSTNGAPAKCSVHSAVWTGTEMIIWGGLNEIGFLNGGGRYQPFTDSWIATASAAPAARFRHSAVWTGSELIVWGGTGNGSVSLNSGARYSPALDVWAPTTTAGAPEARYSHGAVWTGTEMLIWGGESASSSPPGGRYQPATDVWSPMSTSGAPFSRRFDFTTVWTGNEMIVWGGFSGGAVSHGGRYYPTSDTWSNVTMTAAAPGRWNHTAIWTGSRMIIHGGTDGTAKSDTWSYNPTNDTWAALASAPASRDGHTAVWNGTEMFVWGGRTGGTGGGSLLQSGARYHPASNLWSAFTTNNAPSARMEHTAVWTGDTMIVWGGYLNTVLSITTNTGGIYDPAADSWRSTTAFRTPRARGHHTATWTGDMMMVFGGWDSGPLNSLHSYSPPKLMYLYQQP